MPVQSLTSNNILLHHLLMNAKFMKNVATRSLNLT